MSSQLDEVGIEPPEYIQEQMNQEPEEFFSVVGFTNKYLRDKQNERVASENFNASDMGRCYLMRYWKRLGKEGTPIDDRTLRVFAVGNIFHDFFQRITKEGGLSILSEEKMELKDEEGNVLVSGRIDDLIQTEGGKLVLYDYKTVHSKKFHYLVGGERDQHYERQVLLYYIMLKEKYPELADLRILYISKDDMCLKEMPVMITDRAVESVRKEVEEINQYWKEKKEPRAIPKEAWECKYCPYSDTCPQGEEMARAAEQKSFKKSIKL